MSELTENNRKHFDKVASNHQADFGDLIKTVIREIQEHRHWISPKWTDTQPNTEIRLLDYACGAGTVSKALVPYVTQTIGLDLSANMVAEYNKTARELGYSPEVMEAHQFDLLSETSDAKILLPGGILKKFDIIVISMALHHVTDPGKLLGRFAELLNAGGVCVVLDMVPTEDDPDLKGLLAPEQLSVIKTIGKHGFTEREMRELYEGAGMGRGFEYVVIEERFRFMMFGHEFRLTGFIAKGEVV